MAEGRAWLGLSANGMLDRHVRTAMRAIDLYLRDASKALKDVQDLAASFSGGGAPSTPSYVTVANDAGLPNERALAATAPIQLGDGGANGLLTISASLSVPTITFGTTYDAGVATSLIRSDARLKFPASLMTPTSSALATVADDTIDTILTNTLGRFIISSSAAKAVTTLSLRQLNTGAAAGAHANFDDKAGNPPSPIAGDLWRNGASLNYRKDGSTTVDLAAGGGTTPFVTIAKWGTD